MLRKLLILSLISTSLTGCEDFRSQLEPPPFHCRKPHECAHLNQRNKPSVMKQLRESTTPQEDAEPQEDQLKEHSVLPESYTPSVDEVDVFESRPLEHFKELGIKGRRLSPEVAIATSTSLYKKSGHAEPIIGNGVISYPYGLGEAILTCIPQHVCMVEFQAGEHVSHIVNGDSENWSIEHITTGNAPNAKEMAVLKTVYGGGIKTNMMITTDRRIYNIVLKSSNKGAYTPRINFYYPQDTIAFERSNQHKNELLEKMQTPTLAGNISDLHFDYEIEDGEDLTWRPVRVFDDGHKMYIHMPPSMRVTEAPVLFERNKEGKLSIVNYRLHGNQFIVDKLMPEAVMQLGVDDEETVTIKRKG